VGLQVGQPADFYPSSASTGGQFQQSDQQAVNWAKQMLPGFRPVNFMEFYDAEIASSFAPTIPPMQLNTPPSVLNDDVGGYMQVPLTDAHENLR
jgi:hypothetical protein